MSKVVLFSVPQYGHTNMIRPLVGELRDRGGHVICYSSPTFEEAGDIGHQFLAKVT